MTQNWMIKKSLHTLEIKRKGFTSPNCWGYGNNFVSLLHHLVFCLNKYYGKLCNVMELCIKIEAVVSLLMQK